MSPIGSEPPKRPATRPPPKPLDDGWDEPARPRERRVDTPPGLDSVDLSSIRLDAADAEKERQLASDLEKRAQRIFESKLPPPPDDLEDAPEPSPSRPPRKGRDFGGLTFDASGPKSGAYPASSKSGAHSLRPHAELDGEEASRVSPTSVRPPRAPSIRPGASPSRPPVTVFEEAPPAQPFALSGKTLAGIFAVLGLFVVLLLVVVRPGCIFASSGKPVIGTFTSKHLGLAWEFRSEWKYAENLDDVETTPSGWKRRSSVFYRGESANAFTAQMVVLSFERDAPGTPSDAAQLGANETMGSVMKRQCELTTVQPGVEANVCHALGTRPGQPLGVIEIYFLLGGTPVFFRFQHELPHPSVPNPNDPNSDVPSVAEMQLMSAVADAQALIATIRPLPK